MTKTTPADMTPREVDTELARLDERARIIRHAIERFVERAHRTLDESPTRRDGVTTWPTSDPEAVAAVRALAASGAPRVLGRFYAGDVVADLDSAIAELAEVEAEMEPLDAEFARRGWSRFFLVTSSDGHIHSSRSCSTCYITTGFGWLPALSGLDEAAAVAAHGPLLCSVCYPSAPAEWTQGRPAQTAEEAAADGKCINRNGINYRRVGMSHYGDCPACGARGVAATGGGLRKHTHERLQVEAARAERRTNPKLIGTPEGDELKVDGNVIRTVRSAEIAYVDACMWAGYAEHNRSDSPALAEGHRRTAEILLYALAAKAGKTPYDTAGALQARVTRKLREMGLPT